MKKYLLFILVLNFFSSVAQVTQVWTDYNLFWTSSSANINIIKPNTAHNLLAFRWNGTIYSTAVNNTRLTANGVTFTQTKFRALPINEVPLIGSASYFVGLGALVDGLPTTVDNGNTNPFAPLTTGTQKAAFLTKGIQGLDLGSCLANIPTGNVPNLTSLRFNLSSNGITSSNINDGLPDIFISQVALPSNTTFDRLKFVNSSGATVGTELVLDLSSPTLFPVVGNWNVDFYNNNSTQNQNQFINTERTLRFYAVDLTSLMITPANAGQAVALIYTPGGDSDPAFLAFNEPSLGISTQLAITSQPVTSNCDGTMSTNFSVRLQDRLGLSVMQAGIIVTASIETGAGNLLGNLTALTNASGVATFTNLSFEVGGDHKIRFSNSSLDTAVTTNITGAVGCTPNIWTGNGTDNAWNNTANWQSSFIPNANHDVEVPTGRPRYPVLESNAGAKNIILGANATINLNGNLFAINGSITKDITAKIIANTDESLLYMSGSSPQSLPNGLILNGDLANLTIENTIGVSNADALKITQVLLVKDGTFATGNLLDLVCRFSPTRRTAVIGPIGSTGNITGNITVEQCFPARRAFRLVASSVTTTTSIRNNWQENASTWNANPKPGYGTHITGVGATGSDPLLTDGTNGFDWQPSGASSLFGFSNSLQIWSSINSTQGNLIAGAPYRILIRGDRSTNIQTNAAIPSNTILRSTGTIVKGPVTVSGLSSTSNHFNLVGNPFQSVVDMSLVYNASTNLSPFYYVWDPTLGGAPVVGQSGGRGAYVAVNTLTGVKSNALSDVTNQLQPYQSFFVQTSNLGITPLLIFKESDKAPFNTQTNVFRTQNTNEPQDNKYIELTLFNQQAFDTNDSPCDGLRIDFNSQANNNIDENDAVKFPNLDENIARQQENTLISIENRLFPSSGELLPLNVTQYRKNAYSFKINVNAFNDFNVYLKDFYTNQQVLLDNNSTSNYSFTVNEAIPASESANRFAFLFVDSQLSVGSNEQNVNFYLYPNPAEGSSIYLNVNTAFDSANIEIYNLLGQKIKDLYAVFGSNNQLVIPISELETGIYIVTGKTNTGYAFSAKFIKK